MAVTDQPRFLPRCREKSPRPAGWRHRRNRDGPLAIESGNTDDCSFAVVQITTLQESSLGTGS